MNGENNKITKIIFDLDNTLIYITNDWERYYQMFIDKYNFNTTPKELYASVESFNRENKKGIVSKADMYEFISRKLSINLDAEKFDDLLDGYRKIPLIDVDKTIRLLEYLKGRYEIIAYTNWFEGNQIDRLRDNGLYEYFDGVYGWDMVDKKPSAIGLKEVRGETPVSEVMFIGDNLSVDIELPNRVGMQTIFVNNKKISQSRYREVYDIAELMDIL